MPRVSVEEAKTETLREIYDTETGRPISDHLKPFVARIEAELIRRGELVLIHQNGPHE